MDVEKLVEFLQAASEAVALEEGGLGWGQDLGWGQGQLQLGVPDWPLREQLTHLHFQALEFLFLPLADVAAESTGFQHFEFVAATTFL